ncbi:hypothetical protein K1719_039755 [Acacia pycnantha]|nr:hypothetical protein K1719_039755 [Acacia pycnantha]
MADVVPCEHDTWKVVKKFNKKKNGGKEKQVVKSQEKGSKFHVLTSEVAEKVDLVQEGAIVAVEAEQVGVPTDVMGSENVEGPKSDSSKGIVGGKKSGGNKKHGKGKNGNNEKEKSSSGQHGMRKDKRSRDTVEGKGILMLEYGKVGEGGQVPSLTSDVDGGVDMVDPAPIANGGVDLVVEDCMDDGLLLSPLLDPGDTRCFLLTVVYAIPEIVMKNVLWQDIRNFVAAISEPWALVRDFNDVVSLRERTGGTGPNIGRMNLFADRIDQCKLSDLGAVGPWFTWKGPKLSGGRRLFERLDKALANEVFISEFSDY